MRYSVDFFVGRTTKEWLLYWDVLRDYQSYVDTIEDMDNGVVITTFDLNSSEREELYEFLIDEFGLNAVNEI